MERPGIDLKGTVPVTVYAASEGAILVGGIGLIVTEGNAPVGLGGALLGGTLGLVGARWYLPRAREED